MNRRRKFLGWIVTATAAAVLAGIFETGRFLESSQPRLRSGHARPGTGVPPDMRVAVSLEGKTLHLPGCRFIHDHNVREVAAGAAIRQGYTPCVRCMKELLISSLVSGHCID